MSAFDFIPLRGPVRYTDDCEDVDASDYERPAREDTGFTHLAGCRCASCARPARETVAVEGGFRTITTENYSIRCCPCGAQFQWEGFSRDLRPWEDEHRAHLATHRKVSGALQVSGVLAGLLVTHEPTPEWPEAHRYEVRAGRAGEVSTRATSGTAATFREAWAEVLRFIEGQVRP